MTGLADPLVGKRFRVIAPDGFWFPLDFRVVETAPHSLVLENSVERYGVTRVRFDRCLGPVFIEAKESD